MVLRDTAFVTAFRLSMLVAGGQGILAAVAVLPDVQTSTTEVNTVVSEYDPNNPTTNGNVTQAIFSWYGFISYDDGTVVIADVPESPGSDLVPASPITGWAPYRHPKISLRFRFANPVGYTGETNMWLSVTQVDADYGQTDFSVYMCKFHDTGELGVKTVGANSWTRYSGTANDVYWVYFNEGMIRIDRVYPTVRNFYIRKLAPHNGGVPGGRIYFNGLNDGTNYPRRIGQGWEHILYTYEA